MPHLARLLLVTLTLLASPLLAAMPAAAEDPCTSPGTCMVKVENMDACGEKPLILGITCVRHVRVTLRYSAIPGNETRVVLDHEDATGEVRALNTENTWSSVRESVTVYAVGDPIVVGAYLYVSASEPGTATAGQVDATASARGADAPATAGARVLLRNNEPVYCFVSTPAGTHRVPCDGTAVRELLP